MVYLRSDISLLDGLDELDELLASPVIVVPIDEVVSSEAFELEESSSKRRKMDRRLSDELVEALVRGNHEPSMGRADGSALRLGGEPIRVRPALEKAEKRLGLLRVEVVKKDDSLRPVATPPVGGLLVEDGVLDITKHPSNPPGLALVLLPVDVDAPHSGSIHGGKSKLVDKQQVCLMAKDDLGRDGVKLALLGQLPPLLPVVPVIRTGSSGERLAEDVGTLNPGLLLANIAPRGAGVPDGLKMSPREPSGKGSQVNGSPETQEELPVLGARRALLDLALHGPDSVTSPAKEILPGVGLLRIIDRRDPAS